MSAPLSRAGKEPGKLGLTGNAGLQIKPAAKKFGLLKPGVKKAAAAGNIFGNAVEEAEDDADVNAELRRLQASKQARAAAEAAKAAAMQQDSQVFDYDGVYDTMQAQKEQHRQAVGRPKETKARYIDGILAAHKVREIENEKLFERKMVKEAEAEAHLYGDKEKFMTSAYRKKLAEREEYEAELRRKEALEAKDDVKKRADLSHFYSNLLHNNLTTDGQQDSLVAAASQAGASKPSDSTGMAAPPPTSSEPTASSSSADGATGIGMNESPSPSDPSGGMAGASTSQAGGGKDGGASAPGGTSDDLAAAIKLGVEALAGKAPELKVAPEPVAVVYDRRNDADSVKSARERYLARKRQREG